jgi:hypothetical protein
MRRLMIVVGIAAILSGGVVGVSRLNAWSANYQKQAWRFKEYDSFHRTNVPDYCNHCVKMFRQMRDKGSPYMPDERFHIIERAFETVKSQTLIVADHYSALAKKYERAAQRPWWPVSPDPAPPACFDTLEGWLKESLITHKGAFYFPPPIPPNSKPWWTVPGGPIQPGRGEPDSPSNPQ